MATLQDIRQKIVDRRYWLSSHAEDEAYADDLEREDIEHAILRGRIDKKLTSDPRGTRYRVEGPARDGRLVHVVCRIDANGDLIIITVYAKN
jgi:hypothetical protein